MMRLLTSDEGISLVEVLFALLMTGILTAAMFKIYVNQHQTWMIQQSVLDRQQNARAAIDEMTRQLRQAGYQLPNGLAPLEAYDTDPDTVVVCYNSSDCQVTIEYDLTDVTGDLRCDGHDVSCFSSGQLGYIWNPGTSHGEFFGISEVQTGTARILHADCPLTQLYPEGSVVLPLDRVKFFIDNQDTLHPMLMVQYGIYPPQVYAENVTDLQLSYRLRNGTTTSSPIMVSEVREISISLTARSSRREWKFGVDPYRFQTYSSSVYLRNLIS